MSALLELESLMSQQALREAFSESELHAAKQKHQQVQEHVQVRDIVSEFSHLLRHIQSDFCVSIVTNVV